MIRSSYGQKLRYNKVFSWFDTVRYFALLEQLSYLRFMKTRFSIKLEMCYLLVHSDYVHTKITILLWCMLLDHNFGITLFKVIAIQLLCLLSRDFGIDFIWYVCITYWNDVTVTFPFVCHCDVFFQFVVVTLFIFSMQLLFFNDIKITLYFCIFK